ncbi:MAG: hypothetical protein AB7I38_05940 [Dehalococcoidia bacterium]
MNDDERPGEQPDTSEAGEASAAAGSERPPEPGLSPRRAPLRGSGSGFGMAGEGGGAAALLRRVQEAAELARRTAEQHRPAAERAAREAAERARHAVEAARPEAERLARQARAAAEAASPHVERAAADAANYAREHEDEIRSAAARAARTVAPRPLRPAIDAMSDELQKRPEPESGADPPAPPSA